MLALAWWVVAKMIPAVPECPRALAFAISALAMLGVATTPILITRAGEFPSSSSSALTDLAAVCAAAPFVGFAVLLATFASHR